MSLIPELLDPKAQEHIQMETRSSLFQPGSQAWPLSSSQAVSPHQVLCLSRSFPNCLLGVTAHRLWALRTPVPEPLLLQKCPQSAQLGSSQDPLDL